MASVRRCRTARRRDWEIRRDEALAEVQVVLPGSVDDPGHLMYGDSRRTNASSVPQRNAHLMQVLLPINMEGI
jgi:hypothetical protein